MSIGNAEPSTTGYAYAAVDFVENDMETKDLLTLNNLVNRKNKTEWERFLCDGFGVSEDKVKEG
ncbi:MAG TPA: hypothetical protein VFW07_19070 [Parafilimonas sp.]|nr:hypothetical protein [Parafilimonas sp.]